MKRYKIEKLEIKEGKSSGVSSGSCSYGKCYFKEDGSDIITSPEIEDIKIGGTLLVVENAFYFNKTSKIINIIEITDTSVKIETGSSIYLLEILND